MCIFDQLIDRVIPITYESLKEDGWEQVPSSGIYQNIYVKSFIDDIILCTLVATINHNNVLVYKISFYNKAMELGCDDCTELTHMDGIDIILKKYGII